MFRIVLFTVFVGFFVVIGIISLLAILGVVKSPNPKFQKWALAGFLASVTTSVLGLFTVMFLREVALFVTLTPPENVQERGLNLVHGTYQYDEPSNGDGVKTRYGSVELVLGYGGWQVKLPHEVLDKPVRLELTDSEGNSWTVPPFYPNHIQRRLAQSPHPAAGEPRDSWAPPGRGVVLAAELGSPALQSRRPAPKFDNYAREIETRHGRKYYRWRVFVDEPQSVLDAIKEVQYVLHPTFPEPFQLSTNRTKEFELVGNGWGEFQILITVLYRNGGEVKTSYYLDFDKVWPPAKENGLDPAGVRQKSNPGY